MEKGIEKGSRGRYEKGREEARALTIGTFIRKMPDMPDGEVASLFDVTVEYVKKSSGEDEGRVSFLLRRNDRIYSLKNRVMLSAAADNITLFHKIKTAGSFRL
jgi:hypothetical protein